MKCFISFHLECSPGYFGMACKEQCSSYCIEKQPCDFINGECTFGCQDGYIGKYCTTRKKFLSFNVVLYSVLVLFSNPCMFLFWGGLACKSGEYGRNCSFQCAENCNGPCGHVDGSCQDCKAGWKGFDCTEGD